MASLGKALKWGAGVMRVVAAKARLGGRLRLPHGGKPVYLGRGVRIMVEPGGRLELGAGVYVDDWSRLQIGPKARLRVGAGTYMNTNVRITAMQDVTIGERCQVGPNVCVFDHDHVFDDDGVHPELVTSPISIGARCWLGANALVTGGVTIADRTLVGGGAVVTRSLTEPGVYVGSPARLAKATTDRQREGRGNAGSKQGE